MSRNVHDYDRYFRDAVGLGWEPLLAQVSVVRPEGIPAAEEENYRRIRHEREEEDATLPLGAWERELKRADWSAVAALTSTTLSARSKDLQLAAWLFEALIARTGFQSLAPSLGLIEALFAQYGDRLHPQDPEHRVNLLVWIGRKLLPALRKVPITATGAGRDFAWNDWEQAQRNEQLRASLGRNRESEIEGATLNDVGAALASTPHERIAVVQGWLADGVDALDALEQRLDAIMPEDAPGFGAMRDLFERIEVVLSAEMRRRGVVAAPQHDAHQEDDDGEASGDTAPAREHIAGSTDRREVYAALADIAYALEHIEPHSPVPYLIRRAVAWGGLNTAQLYNEVFVRCGGQINIFELLGLAENVDQERGGQPRAAAG
jgi:type VI secretion system ImpA family protein